MLPDHREEKRARCLKARRELIKIAGHEDDPPLRQQRRKNLDHRNGLDVVEEKVQVVVLGNGGQLAADGPAERQLLDDDSVSIREC